MRYLFVSPRSISRYGEGGLTIYFNLGEQNFPFLALFGHFVLLLFAGLFVTRVLLPFEANFFLALCGS